ncbi:DUF4371 domain-containing protein [Trichonephila clavipes]|nr:DUF4371 domain-containing protein [Trichonephila clavipes]
MLKYLSKNCLTSAASYSAANAITRHGKPFKEGEFLKEAWLACAPSLFDDFDNKDKIIQRIKDVPLSRNTMKDRILKLAENVTDITKSARLAVFARYCVGNIIKEELIAITSLLITTKGTDICTAVRNLLAEKEIDLKKIVSLTTYGAPKYDKKKTKSVGKLRETLATVGPIPRHLERAEADARFRLTTGHDLLGVYLHWLSMAANEACPLCFHTGMDGDHLLQCTGLAEYPADDIVSQCWEARRQMVKETSTGVG